MKKTLTIFICLILLFAVGCSVSPENSLPLNGYANDVNSISKWFVVEYDAFINDLNSVLDETYPQLYQSNMYEAMGRVIYSDGEYEDYFAPRIEINFRAGYHHILSLECNVKPEDEYSAQKGIEYFETLVGLFSPRDASTVIEKLHIGSAFDAGVSEYTYTNGNVIYTYTTGQLKIAPTNDIQNDYTPAE